ncbi:ester cyclase [Yinghuangia seranimata]|uniref:ester cyclase n=1 Tax=Yinghuangia seranimata TaxID=408067 RepID=UPI00248AC0D9|nr:ester cyclase [Yinghuangia seranimata]MDI2125686.1 ester cyclase [Yinghuangia seranimata]
MNTASDTTADTAKPTATDATERNKATMRRIYEEAFDRGETAVLDEAFDPGIVNHTAPPEHRTGVAPLHGLVAMLRTAFPDGRTEIEDMAAVGDVVVMRNWYAGTHLGPFLGHEPTGREFRFRQIHWMRFDADGKVVEHWGVRDDVAHLQQLGIIG